ncbi:ABC transporter ATP-binding protein [Bordetella genomosp. 13]|uniref:ABC transporter ATP-binding protein n=1 Tax=Bordetella genomosp. 13 TaxID=463040 RepID=UPI0021B50D4E|nr:ABC transporter ATP-binding protein [Bordetella genomosp. 13]
MATDSLLSIDGLSVRYGSSTALRDVSLRVQGGEVVALLGANGAGKTTLLNAISGFLKPAQGDIRLQGQPIAGEKPYRVFRRGVVQVSQARDLFPAMTVQDNLALGAVTRDDDVSSDLARVLEYFPRLRERMAQKAGTLSGGEQQMAAIGRALMGRPKVLLLDEPSGGLAPLFVQEIGRIMGLLKQTGTTMLIVEQNIALALGVADRYYMLRDGALVREGVPAELGDDYGAVARSYYL